MRSSIVFFLAFAFVFPLYAQVKSKVVKRVRELPQVTAPTPARIKGLKVYFNFEPVKTDLKVKVYRMPVESAPDVGETTIESLSAPINAMGLIQDGVFIRKGAIQPFLMVVENLSAEPKYFFATTHTIVPEEAGVGFNLSCLCNNHIFEIPPNSRWQRIGVVRIEQFAIGNQMRFVHKIVGLKKEEIAEKGLEKNVN